MQDNDDLFKTLCNNCKEPPQKCRCSGQTSVLLMKKVNTKVSCQKNEKKIKNKNLTFFCTTGIFIQQYSIRFEKARAGDDSITCPLLLLHYSAMNSLLYSVAWQTEANSIMEALSYSIAWQLLLILDVSSSGRSIHAESGKIGLIQLPTQVMYMGL
jgi:hypothetical protein